jgi:catechol 2,3-dioxygenase-like lactoylglutathione lyase family enzyme
MPARLARPSADIGLVTADLALSLRFYVEVLGFRRAGELELAGVGTMYRLTSSGTTIKVIHPITPAEAPKRQPATGLAAETGLRYFTLHVQNLYEVLAECPSVLVEPTDTGGGVRFAMILDPDQVLIELVASPGGTDS